MANRTINDLTNVDPSPGLASTDSFELQKTGGGGLSYRVTLDVLDTYFTNVGFATITTDLQTVVAEQALDTVDIIGSGGINVAGISGLDQIQIGVYFNPSAQAGGIKNLTSGDTGSTWTNSEASSLTTFNLPSSALNIWFKFVNVESGQLIRIVPSGSEYIANGGPGKYLEMQSEGSVVWLYCYKAGAWAIDSETGINRIQEET